MLQLSVSGLLIRMSLRAFVSASLVSYLRAGQMASSPADMVGSWGCQVRTCIPSGRDWPGLAPGSGWSFAWLGMPANWPAIEPLPARPWQLPLTERRQVASKVPRCHGGQWLLVGLHTC